MRPALPEEKFKSELVHVLTRYMGWEAVMRIRVSRGWKITKFDGHLFIRGQDLLVVPNCHQDQTFAIQIDMEDLIRKICGDDISNGNKSQMDSI